MSVILQKKKHTHVLFIGRDLRLGLTNTLSVLHCTPGSKSTFHSLEVTSLTGKSSSLTQMNT